MSLLIRLKNDQLTLRKDRNTEAAATLSALLAEATRLTKEPTDRQVIKVIQTFIGNAEEILKVRSDDSRAQSEIELLTPYVPTVVMLTEGQLEVAIEESGLEISLKNMKSIKAHVEGLYPNAVDGALLASVVKRLAS